MGLCACYYIMFDEIFYLHRIVERVHILDQAHVHDIIKQKNATDHPYGVYIQMSLTCLKTGRPYGALCVLQCNV